MIGSILALSIIAAAPQYVQGPPAPSPSTQNIIQAAANLCGQMYETDTDLEIWMSLQETAYNDIRGLYQRYETMGVDIAPAIVFCVEDRFLGPDIINLPGIRQCLVEALGIGGA